MNAEHRDYDMWLGHHLQPAEGVRTTDLCGGTEGNPRYRDSADTIFARYGGKWHWQGSHCANVCTPCMGCLSCAPDYQKNVHPFTD